MIDIKEGHGAVIIETHNETARAAVQLVKTLERPTDGEIRRRTLKDVVDLLSKLEIKN